jgi:hypothetical protein
MSDEMKRLITEIVSIRKEIVRVQDEVNNQSVALQVLREELQAVCPHEEVKEEEEYYSGGYLNKGRNIIRDICTVCGVVVAEEIEEGSYE